MLDRRQCFGNDPDWETRGRNPVALFRADYARYPGEASFQTSITPDVHVILYVASPATASKLEQALSESG